MSSKSDVEAELAAMKGISPSSAPKAIDDAGDRAGAIEARRRPTGRRDDPAASEEA